MTKAKSKELLNCSFCSFETYSVNTLSSHKSSSHPGKTDYECDDCQFQTKITFKAKEHEIRKKRPSGCPSRHLAGSSIILQPPSFPAENDNQNVALKSRQNVALKSQDHTPVSKAGRRRNFSPGLKCPVKCSKCDFTSGFKRNITAHLRTHHAMKEPKTPEVERYATKLPLSKFNGSKRKFQCDKCKFSSNFLAALKSHRRACRAPSMAA